jgi:glycosyltransferase involved in cell wall biosynthesis
LKEIPDAKLVMVGKDGGGELFEACQILVKALDIENSVEFKGILNPDKVKIEMDKASIFVQHSLTTPIQGDKEGTPVAIMEAMSSGLPVVATNHAGISEIITSGENGFLIEEFDYRFMANQMIFCLTNHELMAKIGRNASNSIRSNELIVNHHKILTELLINSK